MSNLQDHTLELARQLNKLTEATLILSDNLTNALERVEILEREVEKLKLPKVRNQSFLDNSFSEDIWT